MFSILILPLALWRGMAYHDTREIVSQTKEMGLLSFEDRVMWGRQAADHPKPGDLEQLSISFEELDYVHGAVYDLLLEVGNQ